MDFLIRPATPDDVPAIAEVNVASWRAAYRGQVPDAVLDALDPAARAESRRGWMSAEEPEMRHWVIEARGKVLGYSDTGPARDEGLPAGAGEVWTIYLHPNSWDAGLGRQLFAHAIDDLRSRGHTTLILWVLESNARARTFYEAAGWQPDGGRKEEDDHGYVMREVRYRLE